MVDHMADTVAPARPADVATVPAVLRCAGLVRRFGHRTAVDDVSLVVQPGETYGLLGPNGAGKTTTIRMVCGLLRPDAGTIVVDDQPVTVGGASAKRLIGYVPQEVALYPDLTARENLRFFGRLYRMPRAALDRRIAEVLELVDLTERASDRVETFSGGMRRRLNIAAGIVHRPRLLVLDEPTVGVDPQSRHAILESVNRFGEVGMAVLYTTHYMEEAERLCDRIGIIDRGRLVAEGTRRELIALVEQQDSITLSATGGLEAFAAECQALAGVARADVTSSGVQLVVGDGGQLLPRVLELAERHDVAVRSVDLSEPDLEDVFLHLTGTALRE